MRYGGRRNAANYAAAFNDGRFTIGKRRHWLAFAVLCALYLADSPLSDNNAPAPLSTCWRRTKGTERHHRNGRLSLLDGRDVAARPRDSMAERAALMSKRRVMSPTG
ncbi:hypothetical protein KCP74_02580 [Salmonella enterica subsp. enterica]|nr:hypothetical protein KCP74_02580 [Salmonella enterica subsp. enterica]